mmetsp:Transcript_23390/g.76009  ORF Transcript_23390/g.76009 Transcript_23390/m.76009 type:complete len:89 (+) Transcript_23390:161-427(+)
MGKHQCHAICDFFGSFGFFVQFVLAVLSFSALIDDGDGDDDDDDDKDKDDVTDVLDAVRVAGGFSGDDGYFYCWPIIMIRVWLLFVLA